MTLVVEEKLGKQLKDALNRSTSVIKELAEKNRQLQVENNRAKLLNEAEAMTYLRRDAGTLLYYRNLGLRYHKQGRDV